MFMKLVSLVSSGNKSVLGGRSSFSTSTSINMRGPMNTSQSDSLFARESVHYAENMMDINSWWLWILSWIDDECHLWSSPRSYFQPVCASAVQPVLSHCGCCRYHWQCSHDRLHYEVGNIYNKPRCYSVQLEHFSLS